MSALHQPVTVGSPEKILVRGLNWLGDAVMATPALQRLRERFPEARITLLTPAKLADLWLHHPSVDEVVSFDAGEGVFSIGGRLRQQRFQLALVLPNSARSALECWLARIPRRVGCSRFWRDWWLTEAIPPLPTHVRMRKRLLREIRQLNHAPAPHPQLPPNAHQIHDYLHLTAVLGANPAPVPPLVCVTSPEIQHTRLTLLRDVQPAGGAGLASSPLLLGLNPGAEYGPAKRWPAASFIAAAREVSSRLGPCRWLLFGAARDRPLCDEIARAMGSSAVNFAGETSLRDLMGLLTLCRVLLTNDTGPMHLAAALGTPVVVPFGSTCAALTGPGLPGDPRHRLLTADAPCAPCFRRACPIDFRCMTALRPEAVAEAVLDVVSQVP